MFSFEILSTDGKARVGRLVTPHGEVQTPAFLPVASAGSVKGVTPDQLRDAAVQIVLGNAYHLMLRPGAETVAHLGGLHKMMGWDGPILTDSGGYQVFSLAHLRKIDEGGVLFQSHIDGAEVRLTPQRAIEVQKLLGSDIIMQLDECPPADATKDQVALAVHRSARWGRMCKDAWEQTHDRSRPEPHAYQALFGIQQGGVFPDLRGESAAALVDLDLPGYAIGGLSVGETREQMCAVLEPVDEQFPRDRTRYLMGVGEPRDILSAVRQGIDMFDCVLPTRNGRNAQGFTFSGKVRLRNARWAEDTSPLDENCPCYTCRHFSRGALRHLFLAREMLGPTLVSIHNIHFFMQFMAAIREGIRAGKLEEMADRWIASIYTDQDGGEQE